MKVRSVMLTLLVIVMIALAACAPASPTEAPPEEAAPAEAPEAEPTHQCRSRLAQCDTLSAPFRPSCTDALETRDET